jgi:hypothetical protein
MEMKIVDLIVRLDLSLIETEQLWPAQVQELKQGFVAVYASIDNDGRIALTRAQILELGERGYTVIEDVIYHPNHWSPIVIAGQVRVCDGRDASVHAVSEEAVRWGRRMRFWS